MAIAYLFDPGTRRPLGPRACQISPVDGQPIWPASSLRVAPPDDLSPLVVLKAGVDSWFIDWDETRAAAADEIRRFARRVRASLSEGASAEEIATWPNKAERARRFVGNKASDADKAALAAEVQARGLGETATALARLQLEKEAGYAAAIALIDGLTRKALTTVEAAPDDQIVAVLATLKGEADAALASLEQ